ncbi:MAG: dTDP-4-dehydrorhamnose 3,5-epimerase [Bacteroidota bacterium]
MKPAPPEIPGLILIETPKFSDSRGYFFESFNQKNFQNFTGLKKEFVQDNLSSSVIHSLRGLHLQVPPFAQGKLVRVIKGKVLDVVVDIRKNSPFYGKHYSVILSEENNLSLWIPEGFAHGFTSLENNTLFSYKCTHYYSKGHERTIQWNDEVLNINWGTKNPVVSEKDNLGLPFASFESPFMYGK